MDKTEALVAKIQKTIQEHQKANPGLNFLDVIGALETMKLTWFDMAQRPPKELSQKTP